MSSGASIGIAAGTPGSQRTLEQGNLERKAKENEERVKNQQDADYISFPNGKLVPAKYKKWIGKSEREHLLSQANNSLLKNAINQIYRPGAFIGNGGTADVIRFEKETGLNLGRTGNHIQKGKEMLKYLKNKVLQEPLVHNDQLLAQRLIDELTQALQRKS